MAKQVQKSIHKLRKGKMMKRFHLFLSVLIMIFLVLDFLMPAYSVQAAEIDYGYWGGLGYTVSYLDFISDSVIIDADSSFESAFVPIADFEKLFLIIKVVSDSDTMSSKLEYRLGCEARSARMCNWINVATWTDTLTEDMTHDTVDFSTAFGEYIQFKFTQLLADSTNEVYIDLVARLGARYYIIVNPGNDFDPSRARSTIQRKFDTNDR